MKVKFTKEMNVTALYKHSMWQSSDVQFHLAAVAKLLPVEVLYSEIQNGTEDLLCYA